MECLLSVNNITLQTGDVWAVRVTSVHHQQRLVIDFDSDDNMTFMVKIWRNYTVSSKMIYCLTANNITEKKTTIIKLLPLK